VGLLLQPVEIECRRRAKRRAGGLVLGLRPAQPGGSEDERCTRG
jgi:hypothetical protein